MNLMCSPIKKEYGTPSKLNSNVLQKRDRGQRSKELKNNICNSVLYLRRCPLVLPEKLTKWNIIAVLYEYFRKHISKSQLTGNLMTYTALSSLYQ